MYIYISRILYLYFYFLFFLFFQIHICTFFLFTIFNICVGCTSCMCAISNDNITCIGQHYIALITIDLRIFSSKNQ